MKPKLILLQLALALCCVSSNAGNAFDFYFDDCESKFSNMSAYCHEALDLKLISLTCQKWERMCQNRNTEVLA